MTTAYTSLLGLALPVTGELSGTWGDTVNNSITSLLDSAIAGTTTLSADTTLTTTTGASNQARQAILLCTGHVANITITAPAQSKIYTIINASATYTVKIRGVGPTTGITIPVSSTATVAWNGSDFVDASGYINGNLKVTGTLSVTGAVTFTAGTASTTTGTGTLVITGGLGVSGRINAANFDGIVGANTAAAGSFTTLTTSSTVTHNGGTANGVAYLNGSKVLTTGSGLVFDGTNLSTTGTIKGSTTIGVGNATPSASGAGITFPATQSASTDANTLDDYEEGTWTPVLQFGANTQTITAEALYTKVGRAVNINLTIAWTAKSGSGRVYITGLPFAKGGSGTIGLIATCAAGSITTTSALFYNIDGGQTILNLAQQSADIDSANIAASGTIACTGTYFV